MGIVPHRSSSWCLEKDVLRECNISWVFSFIIVQMAVHIDLSRYYSSSLFTLISVTVALVLSLFVSHSSLFRCTWKGEASWFRHLLCIFTKIFAVCTCLKVDYLTFGPYIWTPSVCRSHKGYTGGISADLVCSVTIASLRHFTKYYSKDTGAYQTK